MVTDRSKKSYQNDHEHERTASAPILGALVIACFVLVSCESSKPRRIADIRGASLAHAMAQLEMQVPAHLANLRAAEEGDPYAEMALLNSMMNKATAPFRRSYADMDSESGIRAIEFVVSRWQGLLDRGFGPAGVAVAEIGYNPRKRRANRVPEGHFVLSAQEVFALLSRAAEAPLPSEKACAAVASAHLSERLPEADIFRMDLVGDELVPLDPHEREMERFHDLESMGRAVGLELGLPFRPDLAFELLDKACTAGLPSPGRGFTACDNLYWMLQSDSVLGLPPNLELAGHYQKIGEVRRAAMDAASDLAGTRFAAYAGDAKAEQEERRLRDEIQGARRTELFLTSLKALEQSVPRP